MKITVIGCGNSGLIHAAKLLQNQHEVALLKTSGAANSEFYDIIEQEHGYNVKDETDGGRRFFVRPAFITRDVQKAVEFGDILMVTTTTSQHEHVARLIAPYVRDGQLIVLVPGYMGSLIFKRFIQRDVIYSEWETTAYNGRIVDSMYVHITFYNPRNAVSALPVAALPQVVETLSHCFPNTRYTRKHILESALHNPNMIVHPIGIIFSASRIEHSGGEFWMYREAFTPSIINVIQAFDKQKNLILNAFGCDSLDYFEAAKWRNEEDLSKDAMEVFRSFANSSNKGPSSINHRYFHEDIPMGLGLFISIGQIVGVDTSVQESITALASALINKDLRQNARSIQYLLQKNEVTLADIQRAIIE
ncbi:MAG: NAD/NADP octopine/nopaline dehydrogenase family protein [Bacteroidales bacterium]|nr:NAD/NADP octopine/nopaline dehydrogenase family protein [Bacteroidales bacterium]